MARRFFAAAALCLCCVFAAAQDWGGRYTVDIMDGETVCAKGELCLVPLGPGSSEFFLSVTRSDGAVIVYDSQDGPAELRDGCLVWRYPSEEYDYTLTMELHPETSSGIPMENTVRITETVGSGTAPCNIGLSPDGYYRRDPDYFVAPNGYMYRKAPDGNSCTLAFGGIYAGEVQLPQQVIGPFGKSFKVTGIDQNTFTASRNLTQVALSDGSQRVAPGALSFTGVPYDWEKISKPVFSYPDKSKTRFAVPAEPGTEAPEDGAKWVIFKQNLAPCVLSGNTCGDGGKRCGRVDMAFDSTMGFFYTVTEPREAIASMFKGYQNYEIEALIAEQDFVAFHTFPSFGRWKFPEKEQEAKSAIVKQIAKKYGRTPKYSRRAAWLRDGTAELDIVEFEHKNHQAMVVFAWIGKGEIYATGSLTREVEPGSEDFSVWNVDDEGTYGIPDVVTIALDPEGRANIFLAKNSPESIDCFCLHQVGDRFEIVPISQWYRFVDI